MVVSKKDALSETILFHYERGNMYYVCTFCVKVASFGGLNIDSLGIRAESYSFLAQCAFSDLIQNLVFVTFQPLQFAINVSRT